MRTVKVRVDQFLKEYGMHYEKIDVEKCCNDFIEEMKKGLEGKPGTLKMLLTYIGLGGEIPAEKPVIVIDAGGTNFRVAVVRFDGKGKPVVEDFNTYPMPGSRGEIGREEFFDTVAGYLKPVADKSDKIGFCFSYATQILPNKDGRLIFFDKEVRVRDMEGVEIGSTLLKTLKEKGIQGEKKIVLLNDTVATLLGGRAAYPDRRFDSFIGFILGTGTNTCYVEENCEMVKDPDMTVLPGSSLINIESGGYGRAPRGEIDIKFDQGTNDPGSQQFEKMISGAYQGPLLLEILRCAADDGLFSKEFVNRLGPVEKISAMDIDKFCFHPFSEENLLAAVAGTGNTVRETEDRLTLYYLIDAFYERAAKLTAVNLAAVILKTGKGKDPCLPVCVAAEGTTFYKSKLFRGKLDYYVKEYLNDRMGIYCEFVKAENATLVGTAIAGLVG